MSPFLILHSAIGCCLRFMRPIPRRSSTVLWKSMEQHGPVESLKSDEDELNRTLCPNIFLVIEM